MSFTPAIPTTGQSLGASRLQVLNNFASLRTTITNGSQPNHIDVNNAGAGKHIFVQMPVQTAGAANLPLAGEGGLITQTSGGNSELYYVRDNTATYMQMTKGTAKMGANTAKSSQNGQTFLPGGFLMKFGTSNQNATSRTIIFTTDANLDAFTTIYSVFLYPVGSNQTVSLISLTNTQFVLSSVNSAVTINWMAIGI